MARDTRLWARLSLDFADNPKIARLSDAAFRALVEMILYSRQHLTDGVLGAGIVERRWKTQSVSQSVSESVSQSQTDPVTELLTNDPENPSLARNDNGDYVIHGFLDHQESRADVNARKARNLANGKRGGRPKKTQSVSQSVSESVSQSQTQTETRVQSTEIDTSNEVSTPYSPPQGDDTDPVPFDLECEDLTASPTFDEFWEIYPRPQAKQKTRDLWDKALKSRVPARLIIEGAKRHRYDPNREDQYTRTSTRWLREEGWNDPPLPARAAQGRDQVVNGWLEMANQYQAHPETLRMIGGSQP